MKGENAFNVLSLNEICATQIELEDLKTFSGKPYPREHSMDSKMFLKPQ
jgi:hypothetical protein